MPTRYLAVVVFGALASCERFDDLDEIADVGSPAMPAETIEQPRINVEHVGPKVVRHAGVAPVVPALADPRFALPRAQVTAFEDRPPPEPKASTDTERWFSRLDGHTRRLVGEICREGRHDPCFGMLAARVGSPKTRMQELMAQLSTATGDRGWNVHAYCRERDPRIVCDTPLVAAFDDVPVVFEHGTATFSFVPGVPVHTDWPSAATPWIALDRDGDGAITSGAELFGDATVLPDGRTASHGYEALAALDANGDGVIDRRDPKFAELLLWTDRDGDRRSSPSELRPLADTITTIPLAYERSPVCVGGNCEGERGAMQWRDDHGRARTGVVIDVYLRRR